MEKALNHYKCSMQHAHTVCVNVSANGPTKAIGTAESLSAAKKAKESGRHTK